MSSRRKPFDPLLSKLLVTTEDESASTRIKDIKNCMNDCTKHCIENSKTALQSAKEWEEGITKEFARLTRNVDKVLADNEIITKSPSDYLTSKKGEKLRSIAEKVAADASKVSNVFQSSATISTLSLPSEDELNESTVHEEELQLKAEEITAADLEPLLQECLLYFSAFPKDTVIKRRVVIYWWIGEGLVTPTRDGRTAEQVGKGYFKMLIASGLIEPIYQKHSKTAKYCKIYPWVRRMLVSKAKESKFFAFDPKDQLTFDSRKSERACLVKMKEKDQVEMSPESNPYGLRSIFNLSVQYLNCDKGKDQLAKLKNVSALQLGRWQNSSGHHIEVSDTKFLDGLESLKELRYLNLQGISRITELPETIAGLTNLLILNLRLCHNLENVTPAVTYIKSLTHLDVSQCYLLDKMPPGIGSLTNLQVLKGFVVGGIRSTNPCKVSELTQLPKLRKLSIRIGRNADIGKDLYELSKIERLRSLKITWGSIKTPPMGRSIKEPVAQAFSHPKLEKLVLECVPGDESVSWLKPDEFKGLKRLYITAGKLTQLSPVTENDGWNVEILRLKFLKELKLDGLESLKELRYLNLQGISIITELPETIAGLTNLLILDLRLCHNLENVTPAVTYIKSLTHLDVSECYLLDKMPPGIGSMTNLQVLKGFVVGGTRITDPCRLSELTQLKKLRKLSIRIGSEADIGEDLGELSKIEKLKSLKITWGSTKSPQLKSTERKSSRSGKMKESVGRTFSHQNLEKLALECVPDDNSVSWLKPGGFSELKRLYIAGGKLSQSSLVCENDEWNVEILRLKDLKELNFEWDVLRRKFPRLRCVQIYKCPENGPSDLGFDEKGFWVRNENKASTSSMAGTNAPGLMGNEASSSSMAGTSAPVPIRNEGEASSGSMAGTTDPVPMRNEGEASSGSMAGTTAPVPMRNEGEASSSSMAGTTAPVPLRKEGEASSSSLAGTGAPVPMRNEGEASSSTLAGISAPVPMRNEGEASSSSMAGTSAPVPMRNEGEASSSSMTGTSAPIRMRNEEEASSSSIAAASASVVRDDLDS